LVTVSFEIHHFFMVFRLDFQGRRHCYYKFFTPEEACLMKVGFAGLGIMGWPMAAHLVQADHTVVVWTNSPEKRNRFAQEYQVTAADTPAAMAVDCDVIFLCVGDTAMSQESILGAGGLVHGARQGTIVVDCSTISPMASKEMARELSAKGLHLVDAPCTGSKGGAESGTLSFMVGGSQEIVDQVRPLLLAMGKKIYYCGEQGMGLHAKVTQNLILGNLLQAFNEGLVLSTKAGVDPAIMLEILNNSGAQSTLVSAKAPFVFRGDFAPTFSVKWMEKDLALAIEVGASLDVPLAATAVSRQMLRAAVDMGWGEEDICGSIRVLEDIAGCAVRSRSRDTSAS
jgi:3-hydroxyisobutyrate dehydrogenase-like beta-hydroxyacid dehydrogenase